MIFLIEYNRAKGEIVALTAFQDAGRDKAEEARLELELNLHSTGVANEVVLLEAASEEAVRRTHRRYFEDLSELTSAPAR